MKKTVLLSFAAVCFTASAHTQSTALTQVNPLPYPSQTSAVAKPTLFPDLKYKSINEQQNYQFNKIQFIGKKEKLDGKINSEFSETKPLLTADGKTMFFCRQLHPSNIKGKRDGGDIYISQLEGSEWSEPVNAGTALNNKFVNGACSISPQGDQMYLLDTYERNSGHIIGLALSQKEGDNWTLPQPIEIENHYNYNDYIDYFISPSGNVMLLAVERNDSRGNQDLYVSHRQENGKWSAPINLGDRINTPDAEYSPFLSADEKTLYFASYGHKGYGDSDIFAAHRLDDSWQNWTRAKNLGPEINSDQWEAYFYTTPQNDYAYFVSNQGNQQNSKDIYSIQTQQELVAFSLVNLNGQVIDAKSRLPVKAKLLLWQEQQEEFLSMEMHSDHKDGSFEMTLEGGQTYHFKASAEGYMVASGVITVKPNDEINDIRQDIYLTPIRNGQFIKFSKSQINDTQQNEFTKEVADELKKLAWMLKANPNVSVELQTFITTIGQTDDPLSKIDKEKRLIAVRQFLTQQGVDEKRIILKPYDDKQHSSTENLRQGEVGVKIIKN
jgi:hypothetical protein